MKKILFIFFVLPCFLLAGPKVVLLSLDGLAAKYFNEEKVSFFEKIKQKGAYASSLTPVFPSLTFPNHASLITGCDAGAHGVVANRFYSPQKRKFFKYDQNPEWMECEPLWVSAEKQNIKTAVDQWPLSYGAWQGVKPTYFSKRFESNRDDEETLKGILDHLKQKGPQAPQLVVGYVSGPDHEGHVFGASSVQVKKKLKKINRELEAFYASIQKLPDAANIALVLVSDHGMSDVKKQISLTSFALDRFDITQSIVSGPLLFLHLKKAKEKEIQKILNVFKEKGVEVYSTSTWPKIWGNYHEHYGQVVVQLENGTVFQRPSHNEEGVKGTHGFSAQEKDMGGIAFFVGDMFQRKNIGVIEVLDIAPTLSKLLGISKPKHAQKEALDIFVK